MSWGIAVDRSELVNLKLVLATAAQVDAVMAAEALGHDEGGGGWDGDGGGE